MVTKNRLRSLLSVMVVLLVVLFLPRLASAGGWAVISLDRLPQDVTAGQPYPISFMVRQHGITPIQTEAMRIEASHAESGVRLIFIAAPGERFGQHQAELLFPQSGRWRWSIQTGLFPPSQPMPDLHVLAEAAPAQSSDASIASAPAAALATALASAAALPPAAFGLLALLCLSAGLLLIARGRGRSRSAALSGAGLIVLCAALVFAFYTTSVQAASRHAKNGQVAVTGLQADAETGRQLFVAKGCVVCHVNERALDNAVEYSTQAGPNLSAFHSDPAYLRLFLADPSAVRAASNMPNLDLAPDEIESLIAFINSGEND